MSIARSYLSIEPEAQSGNDPAPHKSKIRATQYGDEKRYKTKAILQLTDEFAVKKEPEVPNVSVQSVLIPVAYLDMNKVEFPPNIAQKAFEVKIREYTMEAVAAEIDQLLAAVCKLPLEDRDFASKLAQAVAGNINLGIPSCSPTVVMQKPLMYEDKALLARIEQREYLEQSRLAKSYGQQNQRVVDQTQQYLENSRQQAAPLGPECTFRPDLSQSQATLRQSELKLGESGSKSQERGPQFYIRALPRGDLAEPAPPGRPLPMFEAAQAAQRQEIIEHSIKKQRDFIAASVRLPDYTFIPEISKAGKEFKNDVPDFAERAIIKHREAAAKQKMTNASAAEKRLLGCTFTPDVGRRARADAPEAARAGQNVFDRQIADEFARQVALEAALEKQAIEVRREEDEIRASGLNGVARSSPSSATTLLLSRNRFDYSDVRAGKEEVARLLEGRVRCGAGNTGCTRTQSEPQVEPQADPHRRARMLPEFSKLIDSLVDGQ